MKKPKQLATIWVQKETTRNKVSSIICNTIKIVMFTVVRWKIKNKNGTQYVLYATRTLFDKPRLWSLLIASQLSMPYWNIPTNNIESSTASHLIPQCTLLVGTVNRYLKKKHDKLQIANKSVYSLPNTTMLHCP